MGYKVKDLKLEAERARKISVGNLGKPKSELHRKHISEATKGKKRKPLSEEHKKKLSEALKGKRIGENNPRYGFCHSEETKRRMSETRKGEKHPMFGKHHSEESKRKMRKNHAPMSEESKKHIGDAHKGLLVGEKHYNWKGGSSFEPYCPKFTKEFKERVRAFFDYQCQLCGHVWQPDEKKLSVHHVNFDKQTCCNTAIPSFVPVCSGSCHSKTNGNRIFWQYWFTEMINRLYGGKCYFSKEEMSAYGCGGL